MAFNFYPLSLSLFLVHNTNIIAKELHKMAHPGGRPSSYEPTMLPQLLLSVEKANGSLGQVADLNKIPRSTFYDWLKWGDEHLQACFYDHPLAQLSGSIRRKQSEVVCNLAERAFFDDKAARFITWWLSKICREDFGVEGMEIRELRDIFKVLLPLMNGVQPNGQAKEVDQESNRA